MDYTALASKAAAAIARFGVGAVFLRIETVIDPDRPWEGGEETVVAYPCDIFISSFTNLEMAVTGISIDAIKILISVAGVSFIPTVADQISLTGEDRQFNIQNVRSARPGGAVLYWEVTAL